MRFLDPLAEHFRITKAQKAALAKLRIETVGDLLYHLPSRYESAADIKRVADVKSGDTAVLYGHLSKLAIKRSFKTKIPMAEGSFSDGTGSLKVVWFHQPYLAKMLPEGALVRLRGKITEKNGRKHIANPTAEKVDGIPLMEGASGLFPVYPESSGVTSLWMYHTIQKILRGGVWNTAIDPVPEDVLKRYNLPGLKSALIFAHEPKKQKDADAARKRFAFEEVFLIQVGRALEREAHAALRALEVDAEETRVAEFMKSFPFAPTAGQKKAVADILADFLLPAPMHRLLEGDVGSGKTAVAAATAYAVATSRPSKISDALKLDVGHQVLMKGREKQDFGRLQVAYMVPTEILAKQHFKTFTDFFVKHPIQIGLITGSGCYKFPSKVKPSEATSISRSQFLKWVANGEIPIVIGTHALIQKTVEFKHLAYVIIDEQHRFGTLQRHALTQKSGVSPHLLSMTATPIPRTLALTLYGDLDLTVLDELPAGRLPIKTEVVSPSKRTTIYGSVRKLLNEGRQAFVIVPRIDEPDPEKAMALQTRSVTSEMKNLAKVFPEFSIGKLHSKMSPKEKDDAMKGFVNRSFDILVATSVVEVGVNVPNATVIMIEGAERFGLSQLHQLRGRVMRSSYQPYAFLMVDSNSKADSARLKAIQTAKNGFELAEKDLSIRGAGELYGRAQSGLSDIGMEALKNLKLVEAARAEAFALVKKDSTLSKHPHLLKRAKETVQALHFE